MSYEPVFRDGELHVQAERFPDCVFRSGNPMSLRPGRLADLIAGNLDNDAALVCHRTTYGQAPPAVCRGFYDAYKGDVTALRLAGFLDIIVYDTHRKDTND